MKYDSTKRTNVVVVCVYGGLSFIYWNNMGITLPMRKNLQLAENQSVCANDHAAFVKIYCFEPSKLEDLDGEDGYLRRRENELCLNAKDIVKLEKCGDGSGTVMTNGSSCMCSHVEV
ncbi:hypothetical protein REPUB_Repub16aG0141800 [Reevesia pubescens]